MREFPGEQLIKNACTQPDVLSFAEWANTASGSVCGEGLHCPQPAEAPWPPRRQQWWWQLHLRSAPSQAVASLPVKYWTRVLSIWIDEWTGLLLHASSESGRTALWISISLTLKQEENHIEEDFEWASGLSSSHGDQRQQVAAALGPSPKMPVL